MLALERLVESLSIGEGNGRSEEPSVGVSTYERVLGMTYDIEEAVVLLQQDGDSAVAMSRLEGVVSPVVSEVQRIEAFLASVQPDPPPGAARPNQRLRQGLEAYHAGVLELAQCLEDIELAHLEEARRLFRQGHKALQAAKNDIEEAWEESP